MGWPSGVPGRRRTRERAFAILAPPGRIGGQAGGGAQVVTARDLLGQRQGIAQAQVEALRADSPAQMLAHLTSNGASLRTGDLFGSGTISGPAIERRGSLLS